MKSLKLYLGISLVLIVAVPVGVQAVLLPGYTDHLLGTSFESETVIFSNVVETTGNGTYGIPSTTPANDILDFDPDGLRSECTSLGGFVSHNNHTTLSFLVAAKPGNFIEGLFFSERGDYTTEGGFGGDAIASIGATFIVEIEEVNGDTPVDHNGEFSINNFNPSNASGDMSMQFSVDGYAKVDPWTGSVFIDIRQMMETAGYDETDGATLVDVILNNELSTMATDTGNAAIQKKDADGFTVTAIIPEPASLVLILGTASLFTFIRRRFIG